MNSTPDDRVATPPDYKLQHAQMTQAAQGLLLDWMAESYRYLLSRASPTQQLHCLMAMRGSLEKARQEYADFRDPRLPPEQAKPQGALLREAFDEAARKIEQALGLPTSWGLGCLGSFRAPCVGEDFSLLAQPLPTELPYRAPQGVRPALAWPAALARGFPASVQP